MGYLRFLLALFVILSHAGGLSIPFINHSELPVYNLGGRNAVGLFFMISGFYMALILSDKYKDSIKTFYWNRALRIFPTYWLVLLISVFFIPNDFIRILTTINTLPFWAKLYYGFANLFIEGCNVAFLVSADSTGLHWNPFTLSDAHNGHHLLFNHVMFSVGLELIFYAVAPFMVRSNKVTFITLFLAILYHIIIIITGNVNLVFQYHIFPASFLYFSLGIISYKMYAQKPFELTHKHYYLFLVVATLFLFIQPLLPNMFLFLFPFTIPFLFNLTKSNKVDRFIGDLSYPLYVVHQPAIKYCVQNDIPPGKMTIYVVIISIVLAILIHLVLERPLERLRIKNVKEIHDS